MHRAPVGQSIIFADVGLAVVLLPEADVLGQGFLQCLGGLGFHLLGSLLDLWILSGILVFALDLYSEEAWSWSCAGGGTGSGSRGALVPGAGGLVLDEDNRAAGAFVKRLCLSLESVMVAICGHGG